MISFPKKERGGASVASRVESLIFKDPPKSIHTRKYEPVNLAEVSYMSRPDSEYGDPSRINEAINVWARGVNPAVEIDYSGSGKGSQTTSLVQRAPSAPYKVEVVRPPLQPIETRVPLSNPRTHNNYSIVTNPTREPLSIADKYDKNLVGSMIQEDLAGNIRVNPSQPAFDTVELNRDSASIYTQEVLSGSVRPSASYDLSTSNRDINKLRENATRNELLHYAVSAPVGYSEIVIVDPKFNTSNPVKSNIQNRHYIALQAALGKPIVINQSDGKEISIKDYDYKMVHSNIGNSQIVITVKQPDVKLDRQTLLYAVQANMGSNVVLGDLVRPSKEKEMFRDLPFYSTSSNVSQTQFNPSQIINPDLKLTNNLPLTSALANVSQSSFGSKQLINPNIHLQNNLPLYNAQSNISGQVMSSNLNPQKLQELTRNLPEYAAQTNLSQNITSQLMNQGVKLPVLSNNLPQTSVSAAYGNTLQDLVQRNKEYNLNNHTPLTAATSNVSNSKANLQTVNPDVQLSYNIPLTSASTKISNNQANLQVVNPDLQLERSMPSYTASTNPILKTGYNEESVRDGKVRELTRLSNFGSYEDRVSRPIQSYNPQVHHSSMIRTKS